MNNYEINLSLKINIDSITYDNIKPSLVVFNNDGNSVMFLTTCSENQEEFKILEKLYNTQRTVYKKLKNLKSLNDKEIFNMLLRFLDVKGLSEEELKNIVGNYVYTTDNFIKVILILLRIRAKIPVIMMGETGCGKTTLIEMAFKLINKKNIEIKKLNIHSGTTDKDIIDFIQNLEKEVEEEDKILLNDKVKEFYDIPKKYLEVKLKFWKAKNKKLKVAKFGYFLMKLIHAIHWGYYLKYYVKKLIGIILLMNVLYL
jgi:midasin (ATPase involved in ribosome maturation)